MKVALLMGAAMLVAGPTALAQNKMKSDTMSTKSSTTPTKSGAVRSDAKEDAAEKKMAPRHMKHHKRHHKTHRPGTAMTKNGMTKDDTKK